MDSSMDIERDEWFASNFAEAYYLATKVSGLVIGVENEGFSIPKWVHDNIFELRTYFNKEGWVGGRVINNFKEV